ncbi:innexin inx2-like [Cimex lectularius]|uniref:Innexin n=1 Tax=Cimex lectularius TaxID=79782 RepID=A0A8I6SAX2_CIMLE|nr:innexin inx2-like [Cimex lectularius]
MYFLGNIKDIHELDLTPTNVHIDSWLFKLYKLTGIAFVFLSILVSARLYSGHPMVCTETKELPEDLINAYCWMNSTFTVSLPKDGHTDNRLTTVGTEFYTTGSVKQKYHKYYQWFSLVLLLLSSLCYLPVYLWNRLERGKLELLILGLDSDAITESVKNARKKNLLHYLIKNLHTHKMYALVFFCCEVGVLFLIGAQRSFMNSFFEEELFMFYYKIVLDLIIGSKTTRSNMLSELFPKLTKCTFRMHGPTGELQVFNSLCLLPVNIVAEKVFTALWLWLNILLLVSLILLTSRLMAISFSAIRVYALMPKFRNAPQAKIRKLIQLMDFGDFFILKLILRKIDESICVELVSDLSEALFKK